MCGPPHFFISSVNCWLMLFIPPWHTWGACGSGVITFFPLFIIIILLIIVIITTCGCGHPCLSGLLVNHSWTPFGVGVILSRPTNHVNTPECQSVSIYWLSVLSLSFFMAYVWVFFNCSVISHLILEVCDSQDDCQTVWTCGVEMVWAQFLSCLKMKMIRCTISETGIAGMKIQGHVWIRSALLCQLTL